MDNNQIRRHILKILYKYQFDRSGYAPPGILKQDLPIEDKIAIFNINYLEEKGYLDLIRPVGHGWPLARITSRGIDIIEDNNAFNSQFPLINQTIVQNSPGTVINSENVSVFIYNTFNQIYQEIKNKNPENKDLIIDKIRSIELELEKDDFDKSKIKKSYEWLQRNANWVLPSLAQVMVSVFLSG